MTESAIRNLQPAIEVLAVHSGALGDVVLFGHLLRRLEGRVTLVTGGEKGDLLVGLGAAERAMDFDALPMHEAFADTDLSACRLPGLLGRHDRLISCFGGGDPRAELRLAAACGAGDAAFLPVRPEPSCQSHLLALWADLLGLPPEAPAAVEPWPVPPAWREAAGEALRRAGADAAAPYVVISPGAGSPKKCWPLERFIEVARSVASPRRGGCHGQACFSPDHAGGPVEGTPRTDSGVGAWSGKDGLTMPPPLRRVQAVFVVGPVECDLWPGDTVESLRQEFPVLVCPPLWTLAGVLAGAQALLANDSGVAHLAAAVGATTITLFGPTRPDHFAPFGPSVTILAGPSLEDVSVRSVLDALRD